MTETSTQPLNFRTKDMNQAAYIWCLEGARLEGLEASAKKGGDRQTVHFKFVLPITHEELAKLLIQYANGETRVDPKMYSGKQNDLRDLLHQTLQSRTSRALNS